LLAAEVTKEDLFAACEFLFGEEVDVSVEFLRYLKPSGVKVAYRKKPWKRILTVPLRSMAGLISWNSASKKSIVPISCYRSLLPIAGNFSWMKMVLCVNTNLLPSLLLRVRRVKQIPNRFTKERFLFGNCFLDSIFIIAVK